MSRIAPFILAFALPVAASAAPAAGEVVSVSGTVEAQRASQTSQLENGDTVYAGDKIRSVAGEARIRLNGGPIIEVSGGSVLTVKTSTSNDRLTRVRLWAGKLWARMSSGLGGSFEVETRSAVAGVRGTVFKVEVDDDGRTECEVLEGEVELSATASGDVASIGPGKRGVVTSSGDINVTDASTTRHPLLSSDTDDEGGGKDDGDRQVVDDVPDREKLSQADAAVRRMKLLLTKVIGHLAEAREERDVVKLNCVNEKLTSSKGLLRIAEKSIVTLQEGLARGDSEISSHEFEKIVIARNKSEQLFAESEACVGELAVYTGETEVEVETEDVPKQDPVTQDIGGVVIVEPPPCASCFQ